MNVLRHGDLALVEIETLPKGLAKSETEVIMKGSGNNPHSAKNCTLYLKNDGPFVIGYLVTGEGAYLTHPEHGEGKGPLKKAPLESGKVYELRRQVEDTHEGMKPVVD